MRKKHGNIYLPEGDQAKEKKNMAKIIIECNTNGEAFEILENLLYTINEAKFQAFKNLIEEARRKDYEKIDFYSGEFKKFKDLGKQIRDRARVEL